MVIGHQKCETTKFPKITVILVSFFLYKNKIYAS